MMYVKTLVPIELIHVGVRWEIESDTLRIGFFEVLFIQKIK